MKIRSIVVMAVLFNTLGILLVALSLGGTSFTATKMERVE